MMLRRFILSIPLAAAALLALAAPALAGGWAVTTLDSLPAELQAGETYRIGYTILQHGITPLSGARTEIRARSGVDGELRSFPGRPEGAAGHYVAEVRFPAAGEWAWEVVQEPYGTQKLGTVAVGAAPATALGEPAPSARPATVPGARAAPTELAVLRIALPLTTLIAAALFAWQLVSFRRRTRPVGFDRRRVPSMSR